MRNLLRLKVKINEEKVFGVISYREGKNSITLNSKVLFEKSNFVNDFKSFFSTIQEKR